MLTRRAAIGLVAATPILAVSAREAFAREPETFQSDGIAINGHDPVAYFTEGGPVAGSAEHSLEHKGAVWRFASAANLDAFRGDPEKYGAQFGGYCAFAASRGYIAPTVPEAWTVHGDKLYLNYSLGVRRRWARDIDGNIAKGEANWPGILG